MIAPRWKKIIGDLWLNKLRTILVVLSIGLGVFAVGVVTQTFTIVGKELTESYPKANPASATLYPGLFNDDLVAMVRRMPGIADAEGRSIATAQIKVAEDNQRLFIVYGISDFNDMHVSKVRPQGAYEPAPNVHAENGHWPPAEHEIILERSSFLVPGLVPQDIAVGDKITLSYSDRPRELMVAGLAYHPTFYPAPFANAAIGFVTMDTFEWLFGYGQYDSLLITVSENPLDQEHIRQTTNTVKDKLESGGMTVYNIETPPPGRHPIQDYFTGMLMILNLLGYGSLLLSGFLVVNIINAVLAQQIRQIGIMKAIGARTRQMLAMYLGMVFLFGVLALLVAIPLASAVAGQTTQYLAGFANVDFPNTGVPSDILTLEIAIGIALPLMAALVPIIGGVRITVREALSDYGIPIAKAKPRFALPKIEVGFISRPLLLSMQNTVRRRSRLVLTMATLVLAGVIFIAVNSVHSSMLYTLDDAWKVWNWDVLITFEHPYRQDMVEPTAKAIPGVTTVESWGGAGVRRIRADKSESELIQLFAPPPNTKMMIPTMIEGRWLLPEDENAIVVGIDMLKIEKDIQLGDDIKLKLAGKETKWRVVGKVKIVGQFGGGIGVAYVNYPYFAQVVGQVARAWSVQLLTQEHTGEFQQKVKDDLMAAYKQQGVRVAANSYTNRFLRQNSELFFNIITALLMVMAVLMAIVGGLGLMGTMSINVLERTREIGVMRAIGASNGAIRGIVMTEGVFIGVLSGLISAAVAYPLAQAASNLVGEAIFQFPLSFAFSVTGTIMWLVIVAILAAVASFLPAFNASRLTVRQVLAYE